MDREGSGARRSAAVRGASALLIGLVLVGAAVLPSGCQSRRLQSEILPDAPIAFLYWEGRDATKRGEALAKASEMPGPPPGVERSEEERLRSLLAHLRGEGPLALQQRLAKHPGRLTLYWPGTGELEEVAAAPANAMPLAWSADHQRLLFVSDYRGGRLQIYEYHLARQDLRPVTLGPDEHTRGAFAADGRMAIHRITRTGRYGPYLHELDLTDRGGRALRSLPLEGPPGPLQITPDAGRIIYEKVEVRPRRNGPDTFESFIATRDLAGDGAEVVLMRGREPTLTPDGRWIVFASGSTAGYRLRRMRPDGTSRVPIGPGGSEERMPAVSPDGEYIAFIQIAGERRRLAVRSFDGKRERVLLRNGWSEFPVW